MNETAGYKVGFKELVLFETVYDERTIIQYTYDALARLTEADHAFTGEPRDANGLQYHRARYYAPGLAVWTALDPWEGLHERPMSLNGYSWVEGQVINGVDPSGEALDWALVAVGAASIPAWVPFAIAAAALAAVAVVLVPAALDPCRDPFYDAAACWGWSDDVVPNPSWYDVGCASALAVLAQSQAMPIPAPVPGAPPRPVEGTGSGSSPTVHPGLNDLIESVTMGGAGVYCAQGGGGYNCSDIARNWLRGLKLATLSETFRRSVRFSLWVDGGLKPPVIPSIIQEEYIPYEAYNAALKEIENNPVYQIRLDGKEVGRASAESGSAAFHVYLTFDFANSSIVVDTGSIKEYGSVATAIRRYQSRLEPRPMVWRDCEAYAGLTAGNIDHAIGQIERMGWDAKQQLYWSGIEAGSYGTSCSKPPKFLPG